MGANGASMNFQMVDAESVVGADLFRRLSNHYAIIYKDANGV